MDYIIGTYLTTAIDTQRNIIKTKDDANYIYTWYESIVRLGLNGILLHDDLSEKFIKQFPCIEFIKRSPVPKDIQLYDYRWLLHLWCVKNIKMDNVFFIDVFDARVIMNPFIQSEYNDYTLFCGDQSRPEGNTMKKYINLDAILHNRKLICFPKFREIMSSNRIQLNCGILGGSHQIVSKFLKILCQHIIKAKNRPLDGSVDMALFIYVMYKYFSKNIKYGYPVNSVFRSFENRDDVWFIHK